MSDDQVSCLHHAWARNTSAFQFPLAALLPLWLSASIPWAGDDPCRVMVAWAQPGTESASAKL